MRSQIEKSKETLCDEIEKLSNEKMSDALAAKLSVYHGAYKALCMMEKWGDKEDVATAYAAKTPARTAELDGDTEFEQVIMAIPTDKEHMVALTGIMADHMESLKILNNRAYKNIIMRLKEVAKS